MGTSLSIPPLQTLKNAVLGAHALLPIRLGMDGYRLFLASVGDYLGPAHCPRTVMV